MNKRGMSIIEILAVIVLIGIVGGIGYLATNRLNQRASENAMMIAANDLKSNIIDYMIRTKPTENIFTINLIPLDEQYETIVYPENDPWRKPYQKLYAAVEKSNGQLIIDVYLEVANQGCFVLFENNNILYRSGDTCN